MATTADTVQGCVVVLAGTFGFFLTYGLSYSFGVYYSVLLKHLDSSRQLLGWIGSLNTALLYATAPIGSYMVEKYGPGKVMMFGSALSIIGHFASSMGKEAWHLIITYGLIAGTGFGLCQITSIVAVQLYFRTSSKLYIAVSMVSMGTALGILITPPVVEMLVVEYGWQGSMLVFSAIIANKIVISLIFLATIPMTSSGTPPISDEGDKDVRFETEAAVAKPRNKNLNISEELRQSLETLHHQQCSSVTDSRTFLHRNHQFYLENVQNTTSSNSPGLFRVRSRPKTLDLGELQQYSVVCSELDGNERPSEITIDRTHMKFKADWSPPNIFLLVLFMLHTSSTILFVQLVDHATSQGADLHQAIGLLISVSIGNIIGRGVLSSILALVSCWKPTGVYLLNYHLTIAYNASYGVVMILLAAVPWSTPGGFWIYHLLSFFYGFGFGGHMAVYPNMILELYGSEGFSFILGYSLVFGGVGALMSPPLSGFVRDVTNSYQISLSIAGCLTLLAAGLLPLTRYLANKWYHSHHHYQLQNMNS